MLALGSPHRGAACAALHLALLPIIFYYELGQDQLLHLFNLTERLSLSSLCITTSALGRAGRIAGMTWDYGQKSFEDKIMDTVQQGGWGEGVKQELQPISPMVHFTEGHLLPF